nr:N-acetylglucosamine-6-phosphate deacetylase [uncultured Brevundimonas sp.]
MKHKLINGRVLTPTGLRDGLAVVIENDRIIAVGPADATPTGDNVDLQGRILTPGFIDTQVNGGGGVLFNDETSVEGIAAIGAAHRRFGTTGFLPTLISDELEVIDHAIDAVEAAIAAGVPGVLGIHIEGPFLNERRKGIHDASKFRVLEDQFIERLTRLKGGRTLITLAPETTTADRISRLAAKGAIIAIGHTDADYATARSAFDAGATGATHLFNAMSQLQNRAPGVVGAVLENQTAWAGIIVDGFHVDPAALRIALLCRPHDRFMLVTDAMPSVGADADHFFLHGRRITVKDGVCRDDAGVLAGSDLDMAAAVRNAVVMLGLKLETAVSMAAAAPAAFLDQADLRGAIAPGYQADLVLLNADLSVADTWINGAASHTRAI